MTMDKLMLSCAVATMAALMAAISAGKPAKANDENPALRKAIQLAECCDNPPPTCPPICGRPDRVPEASTAGSE